MTEEDLKFLGFRQVINSCLRQVQTELGLGNISTEEELQQVITRVSAFIDVVEAFTFVHNSSPFEWCDLVTEEIIEECGNDLGSVAISIANRIVFDEVYGELSQKDAYRFLIEGRQTKKILVKIKGTERRVTLRERWKSQAALFDHIPALQMKQYRGKTLAVYKHDEEDEETCYTLLLEHDDPSLVWVSRRLQIEEEERENKIEYYEEQKVETLLHYGCSPDELWLTEVQTTEQFNKYYSTEDETAEEIYGLQDDRFVVYYHESGEVHCHVGFNDEQGFDQACKTIAGYLSK